MRDSWLHCYRCQKRMVIDPLEEEGQAVVTHQCLSCDVRVRAAGERPRRTASPYMADLRRRLWDEVMP